MLDIIVMETTRESCVVADCSDHLAILVTDNTFVAWWEAILQKFMGKIETSHSHSSPCQMMNVEIIMHNNGLQPVENSSRRTIVKNKFRQK